MKNIVSKSLIRFSRNGDNISRTLETNFPINEANNLPYREGVWTIKNIFKEKNSLNPNQIQTFSVEDHNTFKGCLQEENANILSILSNKKKIVKTLSPSVYHLIADDLAEIVYALSIYPNSEIVIDVSSTKEFIQQNKSWDFVKYFLKCLKQNNIKYYLVDFSKYDLIYIDNFAYAHFPFHSGARLNLLSSFFKNSIKINKNIIPNKKVFVSRKLIKSDLNNKNMKNFYYKNDSRIDSHEKLEKLFSDYGFEIVYPENFENYEDQVKYFSSVKTLVSLTSSGIVNAIFMQPQTNLIEIVTPIITKSPILNNQYLIKYGIDPKSDKYDLDLNYFHELHMFYHNLAFMNNMLYIGIPNDTRSFEDIENFINNNNIIKQILENE